MVLKEINRLLSFKITIFHYILFTCIYIYILLLFYLFIFHFLLLFKYSCFHFHTITSPPTTPIPSCHPQPYPLWFCSCVLYMCCLMALPLLSPSIPLPFLSDYCQFVFLFQCLWLCFKFGEVSKLQGKEYEENIQKI